MIQLYSVSSRNQTRKWRKNGRRWKRTKSGDSKKSNKPWKHEGLFWRKKINLRSKMIEFERKRRKKRRKLPRQQSKKLLQEERENVIDNIKAEAMELKFAKSCLCSFVLCEENCSFSSASTVFDYETANKRSIFWMFKSHHSIRKCFHCKSNRL